MDLNTIDDIQLLITPPPDLIDNELIDTVEEEIIDQYKHFDDLGINLLDSISDDVIKIRILGNMIEYINDKYLNLIDYDEITSSNLNLLKFGSLIYKFICIDCNNVFIPNYVQECDIITINHFDMIISDRYRLDINEFKGRFIGIIRALITKLYKLQKLDKNIINNSNYKELLTSYSYYIDLVDSTLPNNFIFNFLRPLLAKNMQSILWRVM